MIRTSLAMLVSSFDIMCKESIVDRWKHCMFFFFFSDYNCMVLLLLNFYCDWSYPSFVFVQKRLVTSLTWHLYLLVW